MNMTTAINYKATAVIDWLSIAITLTGASQHRHIKAVLDAITGENMYAEPLDANKDAGGNATVFAIKFHDRLANDLLALHVVLDELRTVYPFASEPTVHAIEVACDWYWRGTEATQESGLLAITHRLQSSLYASGAASPRQWVPNGLTRHNGKPDGENRYLDNDGNRLDPSLSFRIGNKADNLSWQVYRKLTDHNQTPIQDRSQWRSRVETTLQGAALQQYGLSNLTDLEGYDFRRLMPLFRFRRSKDPSKMAKGNLFVRTVTEEVRRLHDATPERGIHSFESIGRHDKYGNTRAESKHIEADPVLADWVKGALRHLSIGNSHKKKGQKLLPIERSFIEEVLEK